MIIYTLPLKGDRIVPRPVDSIDDCKKEASLLLKDLRSGSKTAAARFQRIKPFSTFDPAAVLEVLDTVQRKHALEVIAREHGFITWKKLKDNSDVVWYPRHSAFLNMWVATYAEAKTWFDTYFPYYGDVAGLDGNNDGIPCQSLPGAP